MTALDFVGFGNSAPLNEPYSVGEYAAWTKDALRLLGVEKPHVIAHSFGCRVAVKMAAADENVFDKLLLCGPAGVIRKRGLRYRARVRAYRFVKAFAPTFAERRFGSKEYRSLSPVMKESYKKIVNEDLRRAAERVKNPVCIVEGEVDRTTPLCEAQAYAERFPRCQLKIMQGGHFAFAEYPTIFNLIAEEFFYV